MNNFYGCIYGLRSPSNKWYIGQTTCEPFRYIYTTYRLAKGGDRTKIHKAILKYGFETFEVKVFVYLLDKESLDLCECKFIEEFNSIKLGYNCRDGGSNGRLSQEVKDKIGIANSGKIRSEEVKLQMSISRINYLSNVSKEDLSKSAERYEYILQNPQRELVKTTNLHKFAKEHGLRSNHLSDRGINKDWRLISKTPLDLISNSNSVSMSLT